MKTFIHLQSDLINQISSLLIERQETISIAESCTGGFLSSCLTSLSGSSHFFVGSVVAYSILLKNDLLGISQNDIKQYGVVSKEVVCLMANNMRKLSNAHWALATTGYAELIDNNSKSYAWIAVASSESVNAQFISFDQSRLENIHAITLKALKLLRKELS
ncbi:CinA family protein [Flavobacteriales bacterium]|nr:CinA family protein [Flavobacteriales bacterium]